MINVLGYDFQIYFPKLQKTKNIHYLSKRANGQRLCCIFGDKKRFLKWARYMTYPWESNGVHGAQTSPCTRKSVVLWNKIACSWLNIHLIMFQMIQKHRSFSRTLLFNTQIEQKLITLKIQMYIMNSLLTGIFLATPLSERLKWELNNMKHKSVWTFNLYTFFR